LIKNKNNPKLINIADNVRNIKRGLINKFNKPVTIATIIAEMKPATTTYGKI